MNKAMHMFWKFNLCVITKSHYFAVLSFTIFGNMVQSSELAHQFWTSSSVEVKGENWHPLNKSSVERELDLHLLKGFSWNRAVVLAL